MRAASFLTWIIFISFPSLSAEARALRTMLNNSGESGHLILFWILGGILSVFTIENNVYCRLIKYGLYYVEVGSFYDHFVKHFYHKWMLYFVKDFSASIEMNIWFLSFHLLIWCITLISI